MVWQTNMFQNSCPRRRRGPLAGARVRPVLHDRFGAVTGALELPVVVTGPDGEFRVDLGGAATLSARKDSADAAAPLSRQHNPIVDEGA